MKSLVCSVLLILSSFYSWSQNKPNVAFISTFDNSMSHYHYGFTIITNYINKYNFDFNCNEFIINYIKQKLSYKFNFVELPPNIPVLDVKEKFNSYEVSKKSYYLLDSLKSHDIEFVIIIQNRLRSLAGGNLNYSGWGVFSYGEGSFAYSSFKLNILNVSIARFGPELPFIESDHTVGIEEIKASNKKDVLFTDDQLSIITPKLMFVTSRVVDQIIPLWQKL